MLIQNATLIDTAPAPRVLPGHDLLVEDGRIAAVGRGLPSAGRTVVDGTGRIVLPGFVDTHRHTWLTALRGSTADMDLMGYLDLVLGRIAPRFRPDDVFHGTLAGAIEALASGVTTVQDYAHIAYTKAHADASVRALRESGVRAVFAYGQPVFGGGGGPDDVRAIHTEHFTGDGLVTMALAASGPSYSPMDAVRAEWALAEELGLRVYAHVGSGPVAEHPIEALRAAGLLTPDITFVHGNSLPDNELALISAAGAAVSICPAVEARMGHGAPMADRLTAHGVTTGLGVDVVSTVAGDMFSLMRATLQTSGLAAADALRLATVDGAAALGMAHHVGSLTVGKAADLVVLRATDPNLVGGEHDPIETVVTSAHPGNVESVFVAGKPARTTIPAELAEALHDSANHVRG
ncbi:amidohydrolase family protein [Allokutzneria sp. A3M-2-11 16]|uniref:amidohydrolase family protein n=1 Tax=Allokutzneria sp. A3M-2-11 16 TaxID=2962043 RepID=UPI0020B8D71C|nr:amidohydrolase family protein [Allokutzneria sp. A3M-2-11 16]MCP3804927.1 amidohydrolase family protein [Allokutzneria sp. A3M-2-11 16]